MINSEAMVSFCGHLDMTSADVTSELSALVKRISWTKWNQLNNTEFNPDVFLNTPEMIKRAGYPAEAHVIMTEDGYLLTLHRIPGGNGSPPVLLLHGILCTSAVWVILGKGKALAYLLADQGYDVWLGNFRGGTYSRAHISLSSSDPKFWDFSFHEMGIYDLPAMITFITNMRSQPLHTYIGHSMGTTSFYVMATERPEIARMVQLMISLGPGAFLNHMQSPVRQFFFSLKDSQTITRVFFHDELFPQNDFVRFLTKYLCYQNFAQKEMCANLIFLTMGSDREQFNYTLLPVILGHFPASTSTKTLLHFGQEIQSGKFCRYDYGREKNFLIYNSVEPPDYNVTSITVPIALFYSDGDLLVASVDVKRLYHLLPNVVDMYEVPWPNFNHVDFLWAKDAPKLVYERILKIMKGKNSTNVTTMG
ncbi:unnamed protein product [Lasius platythorax]|uniref:Lipase n=1 Tax=Lasius platythorax TaxID=488582 RepID=A0AAV2NXC3_9HYME